MRFAMLALLMGPLGACATAAPPTGALSSYQGLTPDPDAMRAKVAAKSDPAALARVQRVRIEPTRFANPKVSAAWMSEAERRVLLREIDAQLCYELSERYEIGGGPEVHIARAFIAEVAPTGQAGSAASAAASFFIPGPIGVRAPTGRGGLAAEAELLDSQGRQLAALTWSRRATVIGTDDPSLSRVGDALQFAEPFADAASAAMTAPGVRGRTPSPDPCSAYGPRLRPEGWLTKFVTGLYVPQMSGAAPEKSAP